jgi:nucleotide-binding universal stress UspA family protein
MRPSFAPPQSAARRRRPHDPLRQIRDPVRRISLMRTARASADTFRMTDHSEGYQHIVVGLDGGKEAWAAFDEALRLVRSSKGRLDVLVADPGPNGADLRSPPVADAYARIAESAAARAGDVPITTFLVGGDPAVAIIEHADKEQCDLIVMGCRSRIGPHPATSASTTTAVSERSRVPVLMVRHISGDEDISAR